MGATHGRSSSLAACVLVSCLTIGAIDDRDTVLIEPGRYEAVGYEIYSEGDTEAAASLAVPLSIRVVVESGPAVNVFLLRESQLPLYEQDEDFDVEGGVEAFGVTTYSKDLSLVQDGIYYLVLDSYDHAAQQWPLDPSNVTYTVTSRDVETAAGLPGLGILAAFAAGAVAAAAMAARLRSR